MKINNISSLIREKSSIENEGFLRECWIAKYSPSNSHRIYYQLRSRIPFKNGKRTRHLKTEEIEEYQKLVLNGRRLKKIEHALAKLKNMKLSTRAVLTSSLSDEHYTPSGYIALARAVMGGIDIDPASSALAQVWIKAKTFYTIKENGLDKPWKGRLWLNPPYGKLVPLWIEKAVDQYKHGSITHGIILVRPAAASQWYMELVISFPRAETYKRIRFIDKNGEPQNSLVHGNVFFYLGNNPIHFRDIFSAVGVVTKPF